MTAVRFGCAVLSICLVGLTLPACASRRTAADDGPEANKPRPPVSLTGLKNPSCVTFSPTGALTVCDSGHGRVLVVEGGAARAHVEGYSTEYWKIDKETGQKRFKLGPLSALWLADGRLLVTDAGLPDGKEVLRLHEGPGGPEDGVATNSVGPTTQDPADKGEGNLTGMALSPGGRHVYVCGQGADAASWVLKADLHTMELVPWASADEHGIEVNSPMQALVLPNGNVLVLYSGKGGAADGVMVEWTAKGATPLVQWTLPGLVDPMGMALVPGRENQFAVVDNNWSLTDVKQGKLARVTLPAGGGEALVTEVSADLRGPVSCAFGPDGRLYIAELGEEFDKTLGRVTSVRF